MEERFLVTGSNGCIGAWTVAQLVGEGTSVVALDASDDDHRLRLVLDERGLGLLTRVRADITDLDALERTLDEHAITHVVHLAALQVPFCRADPPLGARVNVVGTVNVFEAVARRAERMGPVVYASSVAAYDALDDAHAAPAMRGVPSTLYGVYKRANEGTATVYAQERDTPSVGLRPHTVYGPGRDQGLTSAPTSAMLAAAAGRPYRLPFGGAYQLQYAPDVAGAFVAAARGCERGTGRGHRRGGGLHRRPDRGDRRGRARRGDHLRPRAAPVPVGHGRRRPGDAAGRGRGRRHRPLPRSSGPRARLRTSLGPRSGYPLADCGPVRYPAHE